MAKTKKPQDYKTLKDLWYKKLAKTGFYDIEWDEYDFKDVTPSVRFSRPIVIRNWHAKSEYYSMAGRFLHEYKFASNLEKAIWDYHSNGISARNIVKLLKKVKVIKPNKDNISTIIKRLVGKMKEMYMTGSKA